MPSSATAAATAQPAASRPEWSVVPAADAASLEMQAVAGIPPVPQRARGEHLETWQVVPYVVLTVVPVLAVVTALAVCRRRRLQAGAQRLFVELCRRHGIDTAHQRLLRRLAAGALLTQPAELLVFPGQFDAAVAAAVHLRPEQREKLSGIRRQLFGDEAAEPPPAATSSSSCPFPRSLLS